MLGSPEELIDYALTILWDECKDDPEIETRVIKRMNTLAAVQREPIDCPF
jgi:hypothetical protein